MVKPPRFRALRQVGGVFREHREEEPPARIRLRAILGGVYQPVVAIQMNIENPAARRRLALRNAHIPGHLYPPQPVIAFELPGADLGDWIIRQSAREQTPTAARLHPTQSPSYGDIERSAEIHAPVAIPVSVRRKCVQEELGCYVGFGAIVAPVNHPAPVLAQIHVELRPNRRTLAGYLALQRIDARRMRQRHAARRKQG